MNYWNNLLRDYACTFVLCIKEKYLYASTTRKLSQFIKRRKYIGRTERNAVFENQRSSREPEAHIKNFLTPKDVDHEARYNDSNSEVSTGRYSYSLLLTS